MRPNQASKAWHNAITNAKHNLDAARAEGSPLKIDLAQEALNDLLDRFAETLVTRNEGEE